eukprot:gene17849-biopygen26817
MTSTASTSGDRCRTQPFKYSGTSFAEWDIIMTAKICSFTAHTSNSSLTRNWILDTRATEHMTGNPDLLYNIRPVKPISVRTAAGLIQITKVGSACVLGDRGNIITLTKVYLTDSTETPNLLSYSVTCTRNKTMSSYLEGKTCTIMIDNEPYLTATKHRGLYLIPVCNPLLRGPNGIATAAVLRKTPDQQTSGTPGSDQTPYEMFYGTKPSVDHLRIIGCTAYVHIPVKSRSLFAPSAKITRLEGYSDSRKAYRVVDENQKIYDARDITFNEHENLAGLKGFPGPDDQDEISQPNDPPMESEPRHTNTIPPQPYTPPMEPIPDIIPPDPQLRRSERATKKPDFLSCLAASDIPIPRNVKEALSSANWADWQAAMDSEVISLTNMNTWSLADLPPGFKAIGTKWVFDLKRLVSGEIDRFKARLLDVSTAFLNGIVEEEIYCTQPPGFEQDNRVCRMWKCLYGLKQASRQWYLRVKEDMLGLGFKEVEVDQGLFILPGTSNKPLIWVLLWVDDFLLLSFDEKLLLKYKKAIMAFYKTRDLGQPSVFVGFPIPLQPDAPLPYHEAGIPVSGLPLPQIVGSLNYLAVNTRPDIAQAVNRLARHSAHPLHDHMEAATGKLKYLATTPDHGITYTSSNPQKLLTGNCDSDHAACPITKKSTTGWVFLNQGGAIAWSSKIQSSATALSSTEAEYMAASSAAQEAMWLRKLQFCATGIQPPTLTINGDNQAALNAWNQEKMSTRLRHKDTRFHFLKEETKRQNIRLHRVPTAANMADMFTKALPRVKFCDFRTQIGCLGNSHKSL